MGISDKIQGVVARFASLGLSASVTDIAKVVGEETGVADEKWVNNTAIGVLNSLNRPAVVRVRRKDRVLFLPHCLRDAKGCRAKITDEGYRCAGCGRCPIAGIVKECDEYGIRWFIVGGGSAIVELMKKYRPRAVLGVSCFPEAKMAITKLSELSVPFQSVILAKAGCINTRVSVDEVLEKIRLPEEPA